MAKKEQGAWITVVAFISEQEIANRKQESIIVSRYLFLVFNGSGFLKSRASLSKGWMAFITIPVLGLSSAHIWQVIMTPIHTFNQEEQFSNFNHMENFHHAQMAQILIVLIISKGSRDTHPWAHINHGILFARVISYIKWEARKLHPLHCYFLMFYFTCHSRVEHKCNQFLVCN